MSFVPDNSVALTWWFEEERTPATAALLERALPLATLDGALRAAAAIGVATLGD